MDLSDFDDWINDEENKLLQVDNHASKPVVTVWNRLDDSTGEYCTQYRECWPRVYFGTKGELFQTYQSLREADSRVPSTTKLDEVLCKCVRKFTFRECCCSVCIQGQEFLEAFHRGRLGARRQRLVDGLGISCCDLCSDPNDPYWRCTANISSFTRALLCDFQAIPMFSLKGETIEIPRRECCGLGIPGSQLRIPGYYVIEFNGRVMFKSNTRGTPVKTADGRNLQCYWGNRTAGRKIAFPLFVPGNHLRRCLLRGQTGPRMS